MRRSRLFSWAPLDVAQGRAVLRAHSVDMVIGSQPISRKALALVVIFAAILTLIRPICELWHAHSASAAVDVALIAGGDSLADAHPSALRCCPYARDGGAALAIQATVAASPDMPSAAALIASALIAVGFVTRQHPWRRPISRTPQSFHLRSARIRR